MVETTTDDWICVHNTFTIQTMLLLETCRMLVISVLGSCLLDNVMSRLTFNTIMIQTF